MSFIKNKTLGLFVKTNGLISKHLFAGKGLILIFHRVRPTHLMSKFEQNRKWEITPEHLENIIKYFIKKKYHFICTKNINEHLISDIKRPFVAFTFDDGYFDNIEYAYPVFEKYKIPFTIYINTSFINGSRYPWEFIIENFLLKNDYFSFQYSGLHHNCSNRSENEKMKSYTLLYPILKNNNNPVNLDNTLRTVFGQYLNEDYKTVKMIDSKDFTALSNDNIVNFGIHSDNHYVLSQLSYEEQLKEVGDALKKFNILAGKPTNEFAYPYGGPNDINNDTIKVVTHLQIELCYTAWPGNIFKNVNKLLIPRYILDMKTDEKELNYLTNGIRHFSYNGFSQFKNIEKCYSK